MTFSQTIQATRTISQQHRTNCHDSFVVAEAYVHDQHSPLSHPTLTLHRQTFFRICTCLVLEMDFLVSALRAEMGSDGRATASALIDKIAALHAKELKDLRFEISLYRKEAFRLQSENDELRSQMECLRGQARNVSPATTITATTSSNSSSSSVNQLVSTFYQHTPQQQSPFAVQSSNSTSSNINITNSHTTPPRVRQSVKLPTARRSSAQSKTTTTTTTEEKKSSRKSNSAVVENDVHGKSLRLSYPLDPPLPRKFQGDRDAALEAELPVFDAIVNFPSPVTDPTTGRRQCTMCGKERAFHVKAENKDDAVIPNQNKGVCTACDTKVWVVKTTDMQVKWCKGCKNFQCWAAFGDKGWATKCCACRKRMADSYAAKKEQKKARVL